MRTIIIFTLLFVTVNVFAQRQLEYEDRSKPEDICGMGDNEACITFSIKQTIPLLFYMDNKFKKPVSIDTIGVNTNYHLVFDASQGRGNRTITIHADGFTPLVFQKSLSPKQQLTYYLYDPDSTIVDCYNQLTREGLNLFKSGIYDEAAKKYEASKECSNVKNRDEIDKRIELISSIVMWRNLADAAYAHSDYATAIENLSKIYQANPEDKYAFNRLSEAQKKQQEDCAATFRMAETFFTEKDYKSAQPLYEKIVDRSCNESTTAITRLQEIRIQAQRPHVLTYEFSNNTPIGLSIGHYKDHKSAGYFTIRLNSDLFELARTDGNEKLKPELNISFGWTLRPVKEAPVWLFFGPGYTGVGQYSAKNDNTVQYNEDEKLTLNIAHAVSPEIGLLGKIIIANRVGIALRYTYQYRFALDKEMQDYIGKSRHVFGIGFCF